MADWKIGDKSAVTTPATTDTFPCEQSGVVKKITSAQILSLIDNDIIDITSLSWKADTATWTYASASLTFPEYTFTINADATGYMYVGQKIKLTQTAVKYFIVTKVSTWSGSATTITIYGGGTIASPSYALADAAITSPYYATTYRPLDFPLGLNTWSTIITSAELCQKTNATSKTEYVGGAVAWTAGSVITGYYGTGLWDLSLQGTLYYYIGHDTDYGYEGIVTITLSTTNNSLTDTTLTSVSRWYDFKNGYVKYYGDIYKTKRFLSTAIAQWWVLGLSDNYDVVYTRIFGLDGTKSPTIVKLTCAYV
jgi:hypothetical protein